MGAIVRLRGQRRADLRQGLELDPGRLLPHPPDRGDLEGLIRSAVQTHQNMLRVWGGGFYEDERFYDLCDRYGILVWQDFIFSCSIYPLDEPDFLENVRDRSRSRTSGACGTGPAWRSGAATMRWSMGLGRVGLE